MDISSSRLFPGIYPVSFKQADAEMSILLEKVCSMKVALYVRVSTHDQNCELLIDIEVSFERFRPLLQRPSVDWTQTRVET
jgi:hypothetical protein